MKPVVCFGEVLLRLGAPGRELLLQSPSLEVHVAGAEANVAVSLSRFGDPARLITILPDNPLGLAARDELRRHGVDVSGVVFRTGRMGLYFLNPGAGLRPAEVTYDRAGSAFAAAPPDLMDWAALLRDAGRLHLSGVTPATGPLGAEAAIRAAEAALAVGAPVSFDGNYRARLWEQWGGDSPAILRRITATCDIAFIDDRDIARLLGAAFEGDWRGRLQQAATAAFDAFPRLQTIACTQRVQHSVDRHSLSAALIRREERFDSRCYEVESVVDRVGAGDAFAAGVLHILMHGGGGQQALDFGLAASVLKHSIPGDFNLSRAEDVERLLEDDSLSVRR